MCRFGLMVVITLFCASAFSFQPRPMDRTLTLYVDEGHNSVNGHVFVELSDGHNHNFYGFYPSEAQQDTFGKGVSLLGAGGEVRDDRTHHADVQRAYHISKDNYDAAIRGIEAARKEGGHWWLSNHCGDFAEGVAKMAGIDLNLPATWTGRDRPELFAQYLLAHGGEKIRLVAAPSDSYYLAEVAKDAEKVNALAQSYWTRQQEITDPGTAATISSVRESREAGWHYLRALIRYACADPDGFKANVSQNASGVVFSYEVISDFYGSQSSNLSACDRKLRTPSEFRASRELRLARAAGKGLSGQDRCGSRPGRTGAPPRDRAAATSRAGTGNPRISRSFQRGLFALFKSSFLRRPRP